MYMVVVLKKSISIQAEWCHGKTSLILLSMQNFCQLKGDKNSILMHFPSYLLFCEVVKIAGISHLEFYANGRPPTVMVEEQWPHPSASTGIVFHCETAKLFRQVPNNAIVCCNYV